MMSSESETIPLVGGYKRKPRAFDPDYDEMPPPKGALTAPPAHMRRTVNHSQPPFMNAASTNNHNNNNNDGYYASDDGNPYWKGGDDDDLSSAKVDRRSCTQRCVSSVAGCISFCSKPPSSTSKIAGMTITAKRTDSSGNPLLNTDYYEDTFNDEPWECTFGTSEYDGVWINCTDQVGNIMSMMVWVLIIYSIVTISLLSQQTQTISRPVAIIYTTICCLSLSCHAKTMVTDPGSIPTQAIPRPELFQQGITTHAMCSHCQTYKPPNAHHCRICNRCISRMDRKLHV